MYSKRKVQRNSVRQNNTGRDTTRNGRKSRKVVLEPNFSVILVTFITGIVSWVIAYSVYCLCIDIMSRPLLIALMFLILFLSVVMAITLTNIISGTDNYDISPFEGLGMTLVIVVVIAIVLFGCGVLFQWIYGMEFASNVFEPTSYIFVIDDSGSMQENDPDSLRYFAVEEVLSDRPDDFPYMVYGFADDISILRDMAPKSEELGNINGKSEGGTAIRAAMLQVIEDYENQVWEGGDFPKVILLTDGYAGDIGLFQPIKSILKRYKRNGISISTVGLGNVDDNVMKQIANTTGGVFIDVADAGELSGAIISAITQVITRDLLSVRYTNNLNWLYAILRVVFLFLLGSLMGVGVMLAYGQMQGMEVVLISSFIKSLIGALIMELGINMVGFSDKIMWLLLWVLLSLTIAMKETKPIHRSFRKVI